MKPGAARSFSPRAGIYPDSGRQRMADLSDHLGTKNVIKQMFYKMLCTRTGKTLPWGSLTGIRPTKIALTRLEEGWSEEEIRRVYEGNVPGQRREGESQRGDRGPGEAPFWSRWTTSGDTACTWESPSALTICLYCSFTSYPIASGRAGPASTWTPCSMSWSTRRGRWRAARWIRSISAEEPHVPGGGGNRFDFM